MMCTAALDARLARADARAIPKHYVVAGYAAQCRDCDAIFDLRALVCPACASEGFDLIARRRRP